ncbi:hypothetical protein, partial [Pseudomonas aeruginosa]
INLLMLAPSLYMLQVYDRVLGSGNHMTLLMLTLMVLGLYLLLAALQAGAEGGVVDALVELHVELAAGQAL